MQSIENQHSGKQTGFRSPQSVLFFYFATGSFSPVDTSLSLKCQPVSCSLPSHEMVGSPVSCDHGDHMSAIWQVRLNPLLKASLCLSGVASLGIGGYFLIKHSESLPSAVKWTVILLHPVPFVLMKLLLVRAFYFFEIFSDRCSIPFRENAAELQHLKTAGKPFALYLRNHSFESKATIESFLVRPDAEIQPRDGLSHWPVPRNHFEISLVKKVAKCLPVFAIESPDDVTLGAARRVVVEEEDWFDFVSKLIPLARLLIVNYEQNTAGIERELQCIAANDRQGRVLLFAKESSLAELRNKYPEFLAGIWKIVLKKGHSMNDRLEDAEVPEDLLLGLGCNSPNATFHGRLVALGADAER